MDKWTENSAVKTLGKALLERKESYCVVQGGDLSLRMCSAMDFLARGKTLHVKLADRLRIRSL